MTLRLLSTFALTALLAACGGDEPASTNTGATDGGTASGSGQDSSTTENTGDENSGAEGNETPEAKQPVPQMPEDPKPQDPKPEDQKPEDPKPEDPKPQDPKPEGGEETGEDETKPVAGPGIKEPAATGDRALDELVAFIRETEIDVESSGWRLKVPEPKEIEFDDEKSYVWMLETDRGNLEIQLLHKAAPKHVASTAYLSMLGFYDGLGFHRVIKGFMAQGGDPLGTGSGGPAYKYDGEIVDGIKHTGRGVLSMANAGPGTDGSQFFLTFAKQPGLNGRHTVFGRVISGWATLDALEKLADPTANNGVPPLETAIIKKARVVLREGT